MTTAVVTSVIGNSKLVLRLSCERYFSTRKARIVPEDLIS